MKILFLEIFLFSKIRKVIYKIYSETQTSTKKKLLRRYFKTNPIFIFSAEIAVLNILCLGKFVH